MLIEDTIGKTVTNIYSLVEFEVGGLDKGECFVELDSKFIIDIPFDTADSVSIKHLDKNAVSLFADLSDYPVYHVNKDRKTVGEIAEQYQRQNRNIFNKIKNVLLGQNTAIKAYQPYKVEYRENKLKYIKGRQIVDFIYYPHSSDKGLFLLDNGYLITETTVAPHGTGLAGLNYYVSITELTNSRGKDYLKITDKITGQ